MSKLYDDKRQLLYDNGQKVRDRALSRLLYLHALSSKAQSKDPPITYNAEVGRRSDSDARVVVRGVLHGVWVVPLGTELEHGGHDERAALGGYRAAMRMRCSKWSC